MAFLACFVREQEGSDPFQHGHAEMMCDRWEHKAGLHSTGCGSHAGGPCGLSRPPSRDKAPVPQPRSRSGKGRAASPSPATDSRRFSRGRATDAGLHHVHVLLQKPGRADGAGSAAPRGAFLPASGPAAASPGQGSLGTRAGPWPAALHTLMSKLRLFVLLKHKLPEKCSLPGAKPPSARSSPGPAELGQHRPPERSVPRPGAPGARRPLTRLSARRRCPLRRSLRRRLRRRLPAQEAAPQPHHLHLAAGRSPLLCAPGPRTRCPPLARPALAPCLPRACSLPAPSLLPHAPCHASPSCLPLCLGGPVFLIHAWQTPPWGSWIPQGPSQISVLLPAISSRPWKPFLLKPTTPMCSLGKSWL